MVQLPQLITPDTYVPLIGQEPIATIQLITAQLPFIRRGAIECRLSDDPQIDFQVCLQEQFGEMEQLPDFFQQQNLVTEHDAYWQTLLSFYEKFLQKDSPMHGVVPSFWLVYDRLDPMAATPKPWFYVTLPNNTLSHRLNPTLAYQMAAHFRGASPDLENRLASLKQQLPPHAFVCALGMMQARQQQAVRLGFVLPGLDAVGPVLQNLAWPGDKDAFMNALKPLLPWSGMVTLGIDVDQGVLPKIGLDYWIDRTNNVAGIQAFQQNLLQLGGCQKDKITALLEWPAAPSHQQPEKWINHFKIVFDPQMGLTVKAYLFYEFNQLP